MGTGAVCIERGYKSWPGRQAAVLEGLELTIKAGELLAVLGASGVGKSTLLRIIAGIDQLDAGTVRFGLLDEGATRPRTGMVFQRPLLMPWLTVRQNICFAGRFQANRHVFDPAYADDLLAHFGLASVAERYPEQLSGGQAQRVAVIRAVSIRPQLLLLDEPFSALDPAIRGDLQQWLADVTGELGITTVLVTHDVDEAITLGHRIALLGRSGVQQQWDGRRTASTEHLRREILAHYRQPPLAEVS